jgi:hypothetical protein
VPGDLSADLYPDGVIVYDDDRGTAAFAIVVEPQLKYDGKKLFSWPAYVSLVRNIYRCPTYLLVICPRRSVADRYAKLDIELGHPGFTLQLLVLGPECFPVVRTHAEARAEPERPCCPASPTATCARPATPRFFAIDQVASHNYELAVLYHDVVMAALPWQIRSWTG